MRRPTSDSNDLCPKIFSIYKHHHLLTTLYIYTYIYTPIAYTYIYTNIYKMRQKMILPTKQLLILSICRFAEPVVLTSVLPYLPEMIEQVGVPRDQVAKWVGITSAATSLSQAAMAVPWGTASDHFGRKPIILLGLSCTMVVSVLFGLSRTLTALVISRALLGLLNGNVGIIRTMVAEMVPQRDLQPVAFSVMPLVWTVGSIFGPAFGGALARPVEKHPGLFGEDGWVGRVLERFPFLLPNLVAAGLFVVGILTGFLFLEVFFFFQFFPSLQDRSMGE